ncbi:hypothetical protein [Haloechinothrix halophila]|uniref:hypothetical protein n=1 Tax=Haloechinothrix halophila TaxID=1069073 RepID=UPI000551CA96|nr:hypothetical protein [Haloechinothrix halophila]
MGRQPVTAFLRCPTVRRAVAAASAFASAMASVLIVLIIAGCGPTVQYQRTTAAGDPGAGGAAGGGTTPTSAATHDQVVPTTAAAAVTKQRPAAPPKKPKTPPRRTDRRPATPTTDAPAPSTLPPPRPAKARCDWMENFEHGRAGRPADWIIADTGAWGRAEVPGDRIWIAPRTPCDKVYSVAVHEWTHHMQGHVYRDWDEVERELAPYGGPEMVADCGALLLGATWIKYGCPGQVSTDAAAAILRGERPQFRSSS